jgi:GTP-binding protein
VTSAVSREGTWPIMKDVMAFFDRLKEDEQEARDAG